MWSEMTNDINSVYGSFPWCTLCTSNTSSANWAQHCFFCTASHPSSVNYGLHLLCLFLLLRQCPWVCRRNGGTYTLAHFPNSSHLRISSFVTNGSFIAWRISHILLYSCWPCNTLYTSATSHWHPWLKATLVYSHVVQPLRSSTSTWTTSATNVMSFLHFTEHAQAWTREL